MLRKTVLELGGSDPYLILEDADLELAAMISTKGRLVNSGQSCIAAKRFIVVDKVRRAFEELFVKRMSAARIGDPLDEATEVGPLARHDLRNALHRPGSGKHRCRRHLPARRHRPAGSWCLLSAHRADRRAPRHAGLSRGTIRSGRRRHSSQKRGRGGGGCQ